MNNMQEFPFGRSVIYDPGLNVLIDFPPSKTQQIIAQESNSTDRIYRKRLSIKSL
jgi:hypothetical protein